jgi:short-subunit dehydrogenase
MEQIQSPAPDAASFRNAYGPWAVIAGASDGTGAAFARDLARRGVNVVLVARRREVLDDVAASLDVDTRIVVLDLSTETAAAELAAATEGLDVGLLVYNAGANTCTGPLLASALDDLQALVRLNCTTVLGACHHFGGRMVERGRGGVVLVSSGAAWAGAATVALYGATKAFDLVLAEALWAEWRGRGVDVLGLVLGATDTPALRRMLDEYGGDFGELADPAAVAVEAFDHLADGPTWIYGMADPTGASPVGALSRRRAVEALTLGASAMFSNDQR